MKVVNHHIPHSFPSRRSSDLFFAAGFGSARFTAAFLSAGRFGAAFFVGAEGRAMRRSLPNRAAMSPDPDRDRKSTRLNSSHVESSYAVFRLKKILILHLSAIR